MLGQTGERLVVRGPGPRLGLAEGGPQLWLPLNLPPPARSLAARRMRALLRARSNAEMGLAGLMGSIWTEEECQTAGGRFRPHVFG